MIPSSTITMRFSRRTILFAAAALSVPGIVAFRSAVHAQDEGVESVLENASLRLAEIQSLHFTLDIEGETLIDETGAIGLLSAEGELQRPDKVLVEFRISILGAGSVSIRMITIGENSWTTDLITGNWGVAPPEFGYNPSILYDNQDGLGPVMGKLDSATLAGTEKLDGREAWLVTGEVASSTISALTAGTMVGDPVSIELWIDTETYDLLQVRVKEPKSDENDDPAIWTMKLSDFDDEVTIEPPI